MKSIQTIKGLADIINEIKQEILSCLKTDGFNNIKEAIGKDV